MSYRNKEIHTSSRSIDNPYPWKIRDKKREEMITEYMRKFKAISTIYNDSVRQGYDLKLIQFVYAVADVQAQMIVPEQGGLGWDQIAIFGGTPNQSEMKSFFFEQNCQAETGIIDIAVPTGIIAEWSQIAKINMQIANEF